MYLKLASVTTCLAFVLQLLPAAHAAPIPALGSFDGTGYGQFPGINTVYGFEFRTNRSISVLELGVLDGNSNGLSTAHGTGLYTNVGVQLASVTVPAGGGGRLDGPYDPSGLLTGSGFRYVALATPYVLQANTNYVVAGYYGVGSADEVTYSPAFTTNPAITFITSRYRYSGSPSGSGTFSSLVFPSTTSPTRDLMLSFTFEEIPEPSALAIFAILCAAVPRRRHAFCC